MKFHDLLHGAEVLSQSGDPDVSGLNYDSRRVRPRDVFLAMKGESADGNRFIDAAIAKGAVAIVTDSPAEPPRPDVAWAQVTHGRRALARLSANLYRHPAERLTMTGVTGTNGKTTATFLLESIFKAAGRSAVLLGTIEYHVAGKVLAAPHTTPEALEINEALAQGVSAGATEGVMEVSSHALAQERVWGIPFDVAVFTNLTRDHLDYHGDLESYFEAKVRLFRGCGTEPPRVSIINQDDPYGASLLEKGRRSGFRRLTYGLGTGDFTAASVDIGPTGTRFALATPDGTVKVQSTMIGRVNVYNILAAAAAAWARECSLEQIAEGVRNLQHVPGRFERVDAGQPFFVVVDYAHTDDALRNLTALAREFVHGHGRVITVFGCGGDRDRRKRPLMGEVAGRGSDFVVVTSDNPRSEEPGAIIGEALEGLKPTGTRYAVEPDRAKAIALAVREAHADDIVLIAGKGHEKVQVTREGSASFDDVEVARRAIRAAGYAAPAKLVNR